MPEFYDAVITELAGPGLRIKLRQELKIDQRVLVVFDLESSQEHHLHDNKKSGRGTVRVIEDVGIVRHVAEADGGYSVAVELTGLSDTDTNELIRATNIAAVEASGRKDKQEQQNVSAELSS